MGETTNLKNVLLISVFLVATTCSIAAGRTIYVDDDGPADFNNIQAAIDDSSHGDMIVVSPGTYTGYGNHDIDYNGKAITVRSIDPNDPDIVAVTIIDCNGTKEEPHRGFFFNAGEDVNSILDGLTITNGYAFTGGGICCEASRPTITNCFITGNTGGGISCGLNCYLKEPPPEPPTPPLPPGPPGPGGAESSPDILSDVNLSNVTITNCIFSENRGGGMHIAECNATVIYCFFTENLGSGMGVYRSTANLVNCIFSENSSGNGGGMYNVESSLTLTNCTFTGNSAYSAHIDYGYGGGMYNEDSNTTLANCKFIGNSAREGGGMCNLDSNNVTLTNCIFSENSAGEGGGIDNKESSLTLADCSFSGNSSHLDGGGIYSECSSSIITNCTFTDNTSGSAGGGIYCGLPSGSGPYPPPECDFSGSTITYCSFIRNNAFTGGGMSNSGSNMSMTKCIFIKNSAYSSGGMSNSGDNTSLTRCIFRDNWAQHRGGGMLNGIGSATIADCIFSKNSAGLGGGINNYHNSASWVNCTFSGNSATYRGGGMYNDLSSPLLANCKFSGNRATKYGGGMYNDLSSPLLANCKLSGNHATENGGGMYCYNDCTPTLANCTFALNSAENGNALACDSKSQKNQSNVEATNCVFWDGGNEIWNNDNSTIIITYSDVASGWPGEGNIYANPCFVDSGYWADQNDPNIIVEPNEPSAIWVDGDYHLLPYSPCIDSGDPNYEAEPNETDLDGGPRIMNGRIDMGAYEHPGPRETLLLYVDDDATGANDGSSWADAYNYLQDALLVTGRGDEIRVAQGIYKPDQGTGITAGDREATFQLRSGIIMEGSYAGFGAQEPNARDIEVYETVLSGDLNGDDVDVGDPYGLTRAENSYHVINSSQTDTTTVLDGFTVIAGHANGDSEGPHCRGWGMFNESGSPKISNCTFSGNSSSRGSAAYNAFGSPKFENCIFQDSRNAMHNYNCIAELIDCAFMGNRSSIGGGMFNENSELRLTRCSFFNNSVVGMGQAYGGGMYNKDSNLILINCAFEQNWLLVYRKAGWSWTAEGGGMYNTRCNLTLLNCMFIGNSAWRGGVPDYGSSAVLTDPAFTAITSENHAAGMYDILSSSIPGDWQFEPPTSRVSGGGIHNNDSLASIRNCTFAGNSARSGNALACSSFDQEYPSKSNLTNCILWDGVGEVWRDYKSKITVTYSDIEGSWPGNGNIDFDPQFVDPGYWADKNDPNIVIEPNDPDAIWVEGNYHLLAGSLCIGAGDPDYPVDPNETDLDGNPRVISGRIDMGAYEFFNTPPIGDAGPDQIVECACNTDEGTKVTLDGTSSYDADGDLLTYTWTGPFVESPTHGATPTVTLESGCPGEYVITLIVNDGTEGSESDEVVITVVDTTPPEFALSVNPTKLWPANHKMVLITPTWTVSDKCDATPDVSLVSISVNEADDAKGAGNTSDDIQIGDDGSIYLRAERSGTGNDRVYTITYRAVDDCGNAVVRSATVTVPHDQR